MLISYLPSIATYALIIFWLLSFTILFRKRITCMVGMMIAMALGMTIGLSLGAVMGMLFPNYFLEATMISMIAASILGVAAGFPISIMAILDGLLAGVMGGMMGAMLGVMVPSESFSTVTKIMAVLSAGTFYIIFLMIQGEVTLKDKDSRWLRLLYGKPQPLFVVICVFLILVHQLPLTFVQGETKQISIEANEFKFSLHPIELNQGEMVELVLNNTGKLDHHFEIIGTDVHVPIPAGSQNSTFLSLELPGTYKAVCSIPGHEEAGMMTFIKVEMM